MAVFAGPEIVNDGARVIVDSTNVKSYTGGGTLSSGWNNIAEPENQFTQQDWMTGITEFSCTLVLTIFGTNTGYAYTPVSRWGNDSTNTASFVLYHFQQHTTDLNTHRFNWYANIDGIGWTSFSNGPILSKVYPSTYWMGVQYSTDQISSCQGVFWLNGEVDRITNRTFSSGTGSLGSGTGGISWDGGPEKRDGIHQLQEAIIYNKRLSDSEMLTNWIYAKEKYGL